MDRVIEGLVASLEWGVNGASEAWGLGATEWAGIAFVLDVAVKGMLIVAVAGLAAFALRRSSAAVRHFVWTLAAAALLALPLLTLTVPAWRVAVPGVPRALVREARPAEVRAVVVEPAHDVVVIRGGKIHVGETVIVIPRASRRHGRAIEMVTIRPLSPLPPMPPLPPVQPGTRAVPVRPGGRTPRPSYALPPGVGASAAQQRERTLEERERALEERERTLEERERARTRRKRPGGEGLSTAAALGAARGLTTTRGGSGPATRTSQWAPDDAGVAGAPGVPGLASLPWAAVLIGVWIMGVFVVAGRIVLGVVRVRLLMRRAWRVERGWPVPAMRRIAGELGILRPVTLLEGDAGTMPMTWGILRPVILLPAAAAAWPPARVEAVLRHELAHVHRLDALTQMMAEIACAIHWFNPVAWLVVRRLRIEREMACDDHVLAAGSVPSAYAAELVALARTLRPYRANAAIAMAQPAQLKSRVQALLEERRRGGVPVIQALVAAAAALLFVVPLAAMTPAPLRDSAEAALAAVRPVPEIANVPLLLQPGWRIGSPLGKVAPPRFLADATFRAIEPHVIPIRNRGVRITAAPRARREAVAARQSPQTLCWSQSTGSRRTSVNRNDDDYRLTWEGSGCEVEIRIRGVVQFSPDFTEVVSISPNGSVLLSEDAGASERRLQLSPGQEGIEYDWTVDRGQAVYDPAAREWLRAMLLHFTRSTGYGATERSRWILAQQGLPGLLQEIGELRGDYVRRIYYQAALEQGNLDSARAAELLERAATQISSDHEMGRLLTTTSQRFAFDAAILGAFLSASRTLQSDHELRRVLSAVLERGSPGPEELAMLLDAAATINSDHEASTLLRALAASDLSSPALQASFLRAAGTVQSDSEQRRVLARLVGNTPLSPETLTMVLQSAREISSDHELAELLLQIIRTQTLQGEERAEFLRTLDTIQSSHEHGRVASALLRARGSI